MYWLIKQCTAGEKTIRGYGPTEQVAVTSFLKAFKPYLKECGYVAPEIVTLKELIDYVVGELDTPLRIKVDK
jgi:long-subunit acyl-CoA synthetase (AMP-forming)